MKPKLTKTQRELFEAMRRGVTVSHMREWGGGWYAYILGGKKCTITIAALVSKGYAKLDGAINEYVLTGKEAE